jgi:predicted metal-binding membrane protein
MPGATLRRTPTAGRVVVAAMLAVAAVAWVVTVRQMRGMDMAAGTDLGSLAFFMGFWTPMMAAMMLPGAAPAVLRSARAGRRALGGSWFAGSYLGVWVVAGLVVHAAYRPHGSLTAGALTIAAGVYELTPLKRSCRRRCREPAGSGLDLGLSCIGSSAGLMVMLLALGAMSVPLTAIVAVAVLAQKLLPPRASIDVPLALAIVALGLVVLAT